MTRILFVCLGNICRSPTAEAVFARMAETAGLEVIVDSCGTSDWHAGDPPDARAAAEAKSRGYDMSRLRARAFRRTDYRDFDLILAMDYANLRDVEAQRPVGHDTPVRLFMDYSPETGVSEVPDPYYEGNFDRTFDLVEAASRGLVAQLLAGSQTSPADAPKAL